jgi:hypothetical protein
MLRRALPGASRLVTDQAVIMLLLHVVTSFGGSNFRSCE